MSIQLQRLAHAVPEPWRNGGGLTRTLLTWPLGADDWQLRVSVADISADGPFSAFPGVWRGFAVLEGGGVALRFGTSQQPVHRAEPPLAFDGAEAPHCRLLGGPTRDLNLMARHAAGRAAMAWAATLTLLPGPRWRGLYVHGPAWLLRPGLPPVALDGPGLAWSDSDPHPWRMAGAADAPAYWLSLDPPGEPA